jgi:hypothetical protein
MVEQRKSRQQRGQGIKDTEAAYTALKATIAGHCSDPKDRVYGALGIIGRDQAASITVDYSQSVEEVYTSVVASVIEHTSSLDVLMLCSNINTSKGKMPSWVPDLRRFFIPLPLVKSSTSSMMDSLVRPRIVSKHQLLVPGLCIDYIDGLAAMGAVDWWPQLDMVPTKDPGRLHHRYRDLDGLKTAFWNTLLCIEHRDAEAPLPLAQAELETMCQRSPSACILRKFFDMNKDFIIAGQAMETLFDEPDPGRNNLDRMAFWNFVFSRFQSYHCYHRSTFTRGGRLGLVPADALESDTIYALRGLKYLAVLRKHNDVWKFVGQCFMYGLMDGTSPETNEGLEEVEEIVIL